MTSAERKTDGEHRDKENKERIRRRIRCRLCRTCEGNARISKGDIDDLIFSEDAACFTEGVSER